MMRLLNLSLIVSTCALVSTGCSTDQNSAKSPDRLTQTSAKEQISTWPMAARKAADAMIKKHGSPQEITDSTLVWHNSEPFKKSIVYKEKIPHLFPIQHMDVIQQFANYRVPTNKVAEILSFDGSILIDRTKGEISARSESEEMNVLALNLAHEIVHGRLSAEEARTEYNYYSTAYRMGNKNAYLTNLNFKQLPNTADTDKGLQAPTFEAQEATPEEME